MKTKTCTKCGQVYPATTEFFVACGVYKKRSGVILRSWCKSCRKTGSKGSQDKHRRKYKLKSRFNMTLEDYDAMFDKQCGRCKICGSFETRTQDGRITRLAVDHDHKTGRIRGLLCSSCNKALGFVKDDVVILDRMKKYLKTTV